MKYKNKNGIELSYEGHNNDTHVKLIKEVVCKAIEIGDIKDWSKVKLFLKENFSLWII